MKTLKCLAAALFVLGPVSVFGLGGPAGPGLSQRSDLRGEPLKKATAVNAFMSKDLEFIEGSFINEFTINSARKDFTLQAFAAWLPKLGSILDPPKKKQ